ncbi:MAG TPA: hypothetical protein VI279_02625 [Rhodocyclaceae bacterium]
MKPRSAGYIKRWASLGHTDNHPTPEQRHKDFIEGAKLGYDFFKHMTTLSTASLLLLSTLLEKFFRAPSWTALIGATFVGLIASLVFSLIAMFSLSITVTRSGDTKEPFEALAGLGVVGSVGGFLIGIIALATFTLKNFYT